MAFFAVRLVSEDISEKERVDIASFVALASFRTPDLIASFQHASEAYLDFGAKQLFSDKSYVEELVRKANQLDEKSEEEIKKESQEIVDSVVSGEVEFEFDEKYVMMQSIKAAMHVAPILVARKWTVVHIQNERKSFITTDSPVLLTSKEPRDQTVKTYTTFFARPASHRYSFKFFWSAARQHASQRLMSDPSAP